MHDQMERFIDDIARGNMNRRSLVKRATALGLGAPVIAGLVSMTRAQGALAQDGGKLTVASNASDEAPRAEMEARVATFETESGIDVELNTVNHEDFKQAIRTYLASDNPPDVLTWFAGNRMRFFVEKGLIMDVSDVYESEGWNEAFPEGILAVSKGPDDKYYFVPNNYYWWAVYYRKSLFEQAGIEGVPANWDELMSAIDKLNAAGIKAFSLGSKAPWPVAAWFDYLNMRTNGPQFHIDLTDGKVAYNSPEVKETFKNWAALLEKGAFIDAPESYEWADAITPMYNGESAMYLMGGFITDSYPEDGRDDLDFFRFPLINDVPMGEDAPTDGYFGAAKAKNPESAKKFLAYIGGQASQESAARELGRIAINKNVPLDIYPAATQQGIKMLQESDYIAQFYDRDTLPEMAERGMAAFVQFMQNPGDVDSILDDLDKERVRIFAEAEAEG